VVALSDSAGDTVQTYEYSVYGQVAAEDPCHPNPYMFTGRRFDIETGLYYYRARYYNPYIGRFLQTDPVGYDAGINWYMYCANNPVGLVDPSGMILQSTGRIFISPGAFTPSYVGIPFTQRDSNFGVLIDLASIATIASQELRASAPGVVFTLLSAIPFANSTATVWHAYIEVVDYNDRNGDGVIDEKDLGEGETMDDLKSSPFWLEVRGVISKEDHTAGAVYVPDGAAGGGYIGSSKCPGWQAAYHAAEICAAAHRVIGRETPEQYMDKGFTPGADLIRNKPYSGISTWLRRRIFNVGADEVKKAEICPKHGVPKGECGCWKRD
jgi:RHS repeat-associated protein